jgi:hypothetical protein
MLRSGTPWDTRVSASFILSGITADEVTLRKAEDRTPRNTYESCRANADGNASDADSNLNCAQLGRLSSGHSIRKSCRGICKVTPTVFDERRAGCGP